MFLCRNNLTKLEKYAIIYLQRKTLHRALSVGHTDVEEVKGNDNNNNINTTLTNYIVYRARA